ncbi:phage head closure protein [Cronobacter sakazakii]|uniref:phage head closure protein n=1 Tax=Cronobacter sakazakii TaxID=28141 RepID=UPI0009753CB8|nr:phage head closure protein [Cronobacter sakazakii]EGT4489696.1 head-tail adaptor protein [Cronobacter malonaticus]EGT4273723.1 head-tail adaptor protein [Cronobacter sakazakii]EGT4389786.1 head-tail adaptor protein [Cronobacter sakazakii]EGT4393975.1 head-tail adaptor protein [Cronobacter sakazakii]EGT4396986.1 head-tail adaptor protein [Cronobacter sakazakii]
MKAGRLRHRVILQKPATGRLPSGQPATGWVDVASVRAEVADVSGREMMDGGAELSSTTTRIWMRRYPGIPVTTGWRAVHLPPTGGGEIYDIKSAISAESGTRLELLCEKGVKQ